MPSLKLRATTLIAVSSLIWLANSDLAVAKSHKKFTLGQRALRVGMHGHDVRVLQGYLTRLNFTLGVDGRFERRTRRQVRRWERSARLKVDGVLSRRDAKVLRTALDGQANPKSRGPQVVFTGGAAPMEPLPLAKKATLTGKLVTPPLDATAELKKVIEGANEIHDRPYRYGGGHGRFNDNAYDCSGSVSFALHRGGLLDVPKDSSALIGYGAPGVGRLVTIYTKPSHAFMVIAGVRFDTSNRRRTGSRWGKNLPSEAELKSYVARHPEFVGNDMMAATIASVKAK